LVAARDSAALAVAIDTLLHDSSRRAAMGVAGREAVTRMFSVEKIADQFVDLYRELLAGRKQGQQSTGSA
jgi:glycosyltransferase involved in cell wall biosynthesis